MAGVADEVSLKVYYFIKQHFINHSRFPSQREISKHFGWKSQNSATYRLKILKNAKLIDMNKKGIRIL